MRRLALLCLLFVPAALAVDPPAGDGSADARPAEAAEAPGGLGGDLLAAYFGERPGSLLLDPQLLLRDDSRSEIEEFLAYHAEDSAVDFRVSVFAGDQRLPAELDPAALAGSWFEDQAPGFIVFYFAGEPERSEIHLSPGLAAGIPEAERHRILAQAVVAAQREAGVAEQLKAFCVQLAIRVYWMEQEAGLGSGPSGDPVAPATELASMEPGTGEGSRWSAMRERWLAPMAIVAGTALIAGFGVAWTLARRRFRFPEIDVAPRLGGAHGAGIGPVMQFGDTTQSPSGQRERKLDTLGGL